MWLLMMDQTDGIFAGTQYTTNYVYKPDYEPAHDSWFNDHGAATTAISAGKWCSHNRLALP